MDRLPADGIFPSPTVRKSPTTTENAVLAWREWLEFIDLIDGGNCSYAGYSFFEASLDAGLQGHRTGGASDTSSVKTYQDISCRIHLHQFQIAAIGLHRRPDQIQNVLNLLMKAGLRIVLVIGSTSTFRHVSLFGFRGILATGSGEGYRFFCVYTMDMFPHPPGRNHHFLACLAVLAGHVFITSCSSPIRTSDPLGSLRDHTLSPRVHFGAMEALDFETEQQDYLDALHRITWLPGYTVDVRQAALDRLETRDHERLMRTIRQYLPRITAWLWLNRLCDHIADEGWVELTPALVSSWARPSGAVSTEKERPERRALARLYGEDRLLEVVFDLFFESNKVSQQGLRTRCWELIHRLGERDGMIRRIKDGGFPAEDLFLADLRTGVVELGVVPSNREEILWLRKLCKPEYAEFRSQAQAVTSTTDVHLRQELELRDLPIYVSCSLHEPELLEKSREELYAELAASLKLQKSYVQESNYDAYSTNRNQRIYPYRNKLSWGDLAAMRIARRAMSVPQVVEHLFSFAERDRKDKSTEYGGVIRLDEKGRFEVLEFLPRIREHDRKYNAPQALFDAAYDSLFHFHFHAQKHRNKKHAGPGYGDTNYADNTRANCLVLTFINETTLNVDYYRHGGVVVDLGVITRP